MTTAPGMFDRSVSYATPATYAYPSGAAVQRGTASTTGGYSYTGNPAYSPANRAKSSAANTLMYKYQKAFNEAKAANEERYEQILAELAGYGTQREADIRTGYGHQLSQMQQDLVSRGLTGTTVKPSITASVYGNMEDAISRMKEDLLMQRLGFMERRTDTYPDYGMMANLLQGYGAAGGGGGTTGSYGGGGGVYGGSRTTTAQPAAPVATGFDRYRLEDEQLIAAAQARLKQRLAASQPIATYAGYDTTYTPDYARHAGGFLM